MYYEYYMDDDFTDFLQQIIDGGSLKGEPAEGITKQVIDKGIVNLTPQQLYIFYACVMHKFITHKCPICNCNIRLSEMYVAYHNGGLCSRCVCESSKIGGYLQKIKSQLTKKRDIE